MNLQEVKELITVLDTTDISELSLEKDGLKLVIKKRADVTLTVPVLDSPTTEGKGSASNITPEKRKNSSDLLLNAIPEQSVNKYVEITAPMVGTFYLAPAPGAPAFVEVGQKIKVAQTLCIIEAMKLMNEIEAEIEGTLVEILVKNEQPVEFGQGLFVIER